LKKNRILIAGFKSNEARGPVVSNKFGDIVYPFVENDKIKVELWSISEDQFNFYSQARLELNNAGLFSRPAANIPTNIKNVNPASRLQGAGWFGVSAVSSLETVVDPKKARKGLD
jgi:hypothetical protein